MSLELGGGQHYNCVIIIHIYVIGQTPIYLYTEQLRVKALLKDTTFSSAEIWTHNLERKKKTCAANMGT